MNMEFLPKKVSSNRLLNKAKQILSYNVPHSPMWKIKKLIGVKFITHGEFCNLFQYNMSILYLKSAIQNGKLTFLH